MLTMRGRPSANTVPDTQRRLPLRLHRHGDQAFIVADRLARGLFDHHAALVRHHRRRHHVDVAQHRPQQAGQHRRGQRLDIHVRHRALVGDLHFLDRIFGELAGERAELLGERDERLELGRLLGADRGEIDRIGDRAAQQIIRHLLGDLQRDVLLRFRGGGAEMRRAHHVGQAEQRIVRRRLLDKNVKRRAGDLAGFERFDQGGFVHQPAARAIDDAHALFHLLDRRGVDDVPGLFGQRRMQGDEIGALEQLVQLDLLDAQIARALLRQDTGRRRSPSSSGRWRGRRRSNRCCRSR